MAKNNRTSRLVSVYKTFVCKYCGLYYENESKQTVDMRKRLHTKFCSIKHNNEEKFDNEQCNQVCRDNMISTGCFMELYK